MRISWIKNFHIAGILHSTKIVQFSMLKLSHTELRITHAVYIAHAKGVEGRIEGNHFLCFLKNQ